MHHAADFQNVFVHKIVAEHAEAHALTELGTEPSCLREGHRSPAMFAQSLHKCNGTRRVVPCDVGRYLLEIGLGSPAKPKPHLARQSALCHCAILGFELIEQLFTILIGKAAQPSLLSQPA